MRWISKIIHRLTTKPAPLHCGGEGRCDIVDRFGRYLGSIFFRRPTSAEKRNYLYELQHGLATEPNLKILDAAERKEQTIHEIVVTKLAIPFSEKIFLRATGKLLTGEKEPIESLSPDQQFKLIRDFHDHLLMNLVDVAYEADGILKKKF